MRYGKKIWLVVLLAALLGTPEQAHAQYTFGGSPGIFSPGLYPGWGGYGGISASPFGTVPGIGTNQFGPAWNYASPYMSGFNRYSTTILYPGFGASEPPPRMRPSLYPAIPEPPDDVIAAAMGNTPKDRARLEIHVPVATAEVYLDGVLTRQTGIDRVYVTPRLNPTSTYAMNVQVRWQSENGQPVTKQGEVTVIAGKTTTVQPSDLK